MARMSIFNPNMAKLLPKFMKADETDVALSHAMDVLLAEPANRAKILRKWDQIDNMNDAQLDEMAWEFNIDWWDSFFSLETKRSVIRTCYRVHEKRGTKWAVEELITSAFGMGKVTEWFEYGGQPYWFKIQTSATLTKDGMLYFLKHVDCNAVFPMHYWNEPSVIDRFITEYPQYKSRIKNTESAKGEEI